MNNGTAFLLILLIGLILIGISGQKQKREQQIKLNKGLKENFGVSRNGREISISRMEQIPEFFRRHPRPGQLDDITAKDLELDKIFQSVNHTCSMVGEEFLYYCLRSPALSPKEQIYTPEQLDFFETHEKERLSLQLVLTRLGYAGNYSLYSYLDALLELKDLSSAKDYLSNACLVLSFLTLFLNPKIGVLLLIAALVFDFVTYFTEKRKIEPYLECFFYIRRLIDAADKFSTSEGLPFPEEQKRLKEINPEFNVFRRQLYTLAAGTGNSADVLLDYLRILFHLDLICFHRLHCVIAQKKELLDEMMTILGKADAAIAVASYRKSLPCGYCVPSFVSGSGAGSDLPTASCLYEVKGLYHPSLSAPVRNDIRTTGGILLTGANASGKSTFLKAAALAAVMAQSVWTVCAEEYHADYFRVITSMSVQDDLSEGYSYYMAEVSSMLRILKAREEVGAPVLSFVDEVLKGTNTIERIAAAAYILKSFRDPALAGTGISFAATHDRELTELLPAYYENYHFEETAEEGDRIFFSYQLKQGVSSTRNAIRLLKAFGYPDEIVRGAFSRVDYFNKNGEWGNPL